MNNQNLCKQYPEQGKKMTRNVRETHNEYLRDPNVAAQYLNEAQEENDHAACVLGPTEETSMSLKTQ